MKTSNEIIDEILKIASVPSEGDDLYSNDATVLIHVNQIYHTVHNMLVANSRSHGLRSVEIELDENSSALIPSDAMSNSVYEVLGSTSSTSVSATDKWFNIPPVLFAHQAKVISFRIEGNSLIVVKPYGSSTYANSLRIIYNRTVYPLVLTSAAVQLNEKVSDLWSFSTIPTTFSAGNTYTLQRDFRNAEDIVVSDVAVVNGNSLVEFGESVLAPQAGDWLCPHMEVVIPILPHEYVQHLIAACSATLAGAEDSVKSIWSQIQAIMSAQLSKQSRVEHAALSNVSKNILFDL